MNRSVQFRKSILDQLMRTPGITTTDVAKSLGASRTTVIHYLRDMLADGVVRFQAAGPSKLWFVVNKEAERDRVRAIAEETGKRLESFIEDAFRLDLLEENEVKKLRNLTRIVKRKGERHNNGE
jgi:DNA-binding IclR family transcriptional regulator